MQEKATRLNQGKRRWGLLDFTCLEELVKVLEFGANKYTPLNWKKGFNRQELLESAMRHLVALFNGKEDDDETFLSHAAHIMCNMMFYIYCRINNKFVE